MARPARRVIPMQLWMGIALLALMGVSLGLLGGGGSILAVPILVYVLGVEPHAAIAVSLLLVGSTALLAALLHLWEGRVDVRAGALFALLAAPVSLLGASVMKSFQGRTLLFLFALLMVGLSIPMWRGRSEPDGERRPRRWMLLVASAAAVGFLTGFLGIGGGFLIVPALVLVLGMPMKRAVGTSLLVIALNCAVALFGHRASFQLENRFLVPAMAALVGTLVGVQIARRVEPRHLRQGFALFILALGLWMAWRNLPW